MLSNLLTNELAQEIVDKMIKDIPYSINIMNEKGMIIGSGDRSRVGTLHQGAVQAIQCRKIIEIYKDEQDMKKGTNEPILMGDQLIGVVGITGDPDEVRPFCKLVKTTVTLLIELIGNREAERNREAAFLDALLTETKEYSQELIEEAQHFHINLHQETTVVLIKNLEKPLPFPSFKKQNEDFVIVLLQNPNDIEKILNPHCIVAAGSHASNVATSYQQAYQCMKIAENLYLSERFYDYKRFRFLAELSQAPIEAKQLNLSNILLQTLKTYINHNGNPTDTAQALMIHRNTLYYRLERIKGLTGKDPGNLIDLTELLFLLLQK